MQKKFVLLFFLAAVVMSFAAGFIFKDVIPISFFDTANDPFSQITDVLDDYYYYDLNDEAKLEAYVSQMDAIVDAYGNYFNDPYTRLEALSQSSDFIGLGIRFYFDGLIPVVSSVFYEAPAYLKLFPGDRIVGVVTSSNISFSSLSSTDEVLNYLSGNSGDEKTFIIENEDEIIRNVSITLDIIESPNIDIKAFKDDNISYIRIHTFSPYVDQNNVGTAQLFKQALTDFEAQGMDENHTLIIDLRDNPGGSLSALHNLNFPDYPIGIIQQLMPYDSAMPAFEMTDHENRVTRFYGGLTEPKPYDIAVLVNNQSASASEVLAAALSTYGYQIYGEETFGKHVYQNQYPLTQINDTQYMLIYTEGIWSYNDGLTVNTDPIDVTSVAANPYLEIASFSFEGTKSFDDVDQSISNYQIFLNEYLNATLREDGYYDQATENEVRMFQVQMSIEVTGSINFETFQAMYEIYMRRIHDITFDTQLLALIEMLS